ncbi:MAG: hypothetical protein AAFZ18_25060 [Myxococcota bacterium]
MRRLRSWLGLALGGAVVAWTGSSRADDAVIERFDQAKVDWSRGEILAAGSGTPNPALGGVARVRVEAERAAKLDAYRHVLEALEGVRVTASASGRDRLADPGVRATVQGLLHGCGVKDSRYYSDGGVDVVLRCPFRGGLVNALLPATRRAPGRDASAPRVDGEPALVTGLIVDATGIDARPLMIPTVRDGRGQVIMVGPKIITKEALQTHGGVAYVATFEEARSRARVGPRPLVVRIGSVSRQGWELAPGEADKLRGLDLDFVAEGGVVVILPRPEKK